MFGPYRAGFFLFYSPQGVAPGRYVNAPFGATAQRRRFLDFALNRRRRRMQLPEASARDHPVSFAGASVSMIVVEVAVCPTYE